MTPEQRLAFDWSIYGVLTVVLCTRTYILWRRTGRPISKDMSDAGLLLGYILTLAVFICNAWMLNREIQTRKLQGKEFILPIYNLQIGDAITVGKVGLD